MPIQPSSGSTGQLNVFALYGFAALTGLFAKNLPGDAARSGPPPPHG